MRATAATAEENLGVELGSVLAGKYRVDAIVGQGGMGVVSRATQLQLNETVAIKFLRADVAGDAEATQRFMREAQAAFKLKGEHVARVLDVGTTEDDIPYLVMEFLDGVDLDGMLEQSSRVTPPLAVDFIIQACEGLAEAHSFGIVHRDVKPSNFFVTWRSDGTPLVKLLDFGISKLANNTDVSLTQTQSMLGTPAYMSPEQMRSARTVDPRSDIWSLGAVLYELCEGTRPFEAESFSEMCVKVAIDPPAPMTVPMPPGLEAVIGRCLEKKPEARFQTTTEVAEALAPFARDPRLAAAAVARIERMVGRGATPVAIHDAKSAPIQKTLASAMPPMPSPSSGDQHPYLPKKTTPWASGGAFPAHQAPLTPPVALPPLSMTPTVVVAVAPGQAWMTPPSSPSIQPLRGTGLASDTIDDTLRGPRTTGSIRTPRRVGVIALVAVLVVIAAMVGIAGLGGGRAPTPTKPNEPAPTKPNEPAPTGSGSATGSDTGSGSATGSDTGLGSGSDTGTDSATGSAAAGVGSGSASKTVVGADSGSGKTGHGKRGNGKRGNGKRGNGKRDSVKTDPIFGTRN